LNQDSATTSYCSDLFFGVFHRSRIVQLWSEWCLYGGVLQEAISWELEDEKVSVTIGKKNSCSVLVVSPIVVFFGTMLDGN
jgi:hypothetical protein